MKRSRTAPAVPVIPPSTSVTTTCNSSRKPPAASTDCEVPGRVATLIHLIPGRYSRSLYSLLTEVIATAVELVS